MQPNILHSTRMQCLKTKDIDLTEKLRKYPDSGEYSTGPTQQTLLCSVFCESLHGKGSDKSDFEKLLN